MKSKAELAIVLATAFLLGAVNLAKPVHIDDALYLAIAEQIATSPADPYGGTLNWQQIPEPTYKVSISPPLLSYYFAGATAVFGRSEPALHAAMIPWLLLLAWATYSLFRRWTAAALPAALLVIVSPLHAVGINLMLDVPLLACCCAALEWSLRSSENAWPGRDALLAGLAAGAAVLIKYPAVALVPLLAYVGWQWKNPRLYLSAAAPCLAVVAWQAYSRSLYGASQVGEAMGFLDQFQLGLVRQVAQRGLNILAILGMTFPVWLLAFSRRGGWRVAVPLAAVVGFAAFWATREENGATMATTFAVACLLGAIAVAASAWRTVRGLSSKHDLPESPPTFNDPSDESSREVGPAKLSTPRFGGDPTMLLWLWIAGFTAVVTLFGPFIAVRSVLPLAPPLALLAARLFRPSRTQWTLALGVACSLSALLVWTDHRWARFYPQAARQIADNVDRPVYFLGHWGWQHYMQKQGFKAWDARWNAVPTNATLVIPVRADKQFLSPDAVHSLKEVDRIVLPAHPLRLTVWNRRAKIRFYGGDFGELPWGLSSQPTEELFLLETR